MRDRKQGTGWGWAAVCALAAAAVSAAQSASAAGAAGAGIRVFHVSPEGDDAAEGTEARPFATFARAQEAVRRHKERTPEREIGRIEVVFEGGEYVLDGPVVIGPEHGGTDAYPAVYRSRDPGRPAVFSGGRAVSGWKIRGDGSWAAFLPGVKAGKWNFSQLFVNGARRFRPCLPARGYYRTAGDFGKTEKGIGGFVYRAGDVDPAWANREDCEFLVLHVWSASRMRAAAVDPRAKVVKFTAMRPWSASWSNFRNRRYRVENVKEAFGAPGSWYLDRPSGVLSYMPLPGETPGACRVEAPALDRLLIVRGRPGAPVRNTRLEGLVFRMARWVTPRAGDFTPQGAVNIPAAAEVSRARGVTISRCAFTQLGGYALAFGPGASGDTAESCLMRDLGAGGVKIGPPYMGYETVPPPANPITSKTEDGIDNNTSAITVRNCRIVHGGRIHPAAHGVWIGQSSHNRILHNEIADLYYTAVSVGWVWGYAAPSRSHHNEVAFNHMHDIGQGVLSDMGGVYTLGLSPGTSVHDNRIHGVHAFDYGGWGLYTDEGSTGIHIFNNLVYDVKTGCFHQHYGRDNVIENNIFANSLTDQLQRSRREPHISFYFRRNIVYWDNDGALLGKNWGGGKRGVKDGRPTQGYEMSSNLYWHASGKTGFFPGGKTLEQWRRETGQEAGSLVADPLFADAANGDFRPAAASPARTIGFQPFDVRAAGPDAPGRIPRWSGAPVPTPYEIRAGLRKTAGAKRL